MRLLILGGWGQLGSDLFLSAQGRHDVIRPRRIEVDVTDQDAVGAFVADRHPDAVVDAAAFHRVEACETDPVRAFEVNALGALGVARASRRAGARCVYIGTDYVFDGGLPQGYEEDSPVAPLNVYGVSKAAGERLVRIACPDSLIVRGSGMFGHAGSSGKGGNFVETMLAKAAAGEPIRVVDDQVFSPTSTRDMAERILVLLEREVPSGIYHAANSGSCSWYGFARALFDLAGLQVDLSPRSTGPEAEESVRRPHWSILLDTRGAELGLPPNRSWEEALEWYLAARPRQSVGAAAEATR
jgi:dTDP-4-dehydrorhamnose reductase